jgi:hypothetical protein
MNTKSCLPFQAEIEDGAAANRAIGSAAQEHLTACSVCTAAFDEHSRLRELIAGLEPVTAPADFDFRLRARLSSVAPRKASAFGWRWNAWKAPVFGLATAAALAVGGTAAFNSGMFRMSTEHGPLNAAGQIQAGVASLVWNKDEPTTVAVVPDRPTTSAVSDRTGAASRRNSGIQSSEISVKGPAQTIVPVGFDQPDPNNGEFEVLGRTSASKPITVQERGRRRSVSVSPYSFGSQDMITPASSGALPPASERIW